MADEADRLAEVEARNAALEAELALYRDAVEHMHQGLCMFDADGHIALVNRRYAELMKLPPGSVRPGMSGADVVQLCVDAGYHPGRSAEEVAAEIRGQIQAGSPSLRRMVRGGRSYAVKQQRTETQHLVTTCEDITAQIEAEGALRDSMARLRAILDAMPDCVKIFDASARLIHINPHGLEMLQAHDLESLTAPGYSAVPDEYLQECLDVHQRVMAGESVVWTYEMVGLQGRRLHVEAHAVPFRMPDGSVVHLCISRDVEGRKQAESAVRESEERFRLAAEAAGLGVWDYDLTLDRRQWSDRLREIFGIARDAAPSLKLAEACIHPADRARFMRTLRLARSTDVGRFEATFRVRRANDGAERWVTLNGWRTLRADSQQRRIIMTVRDVTEEKTAEERVRWTASHDPLTKLANRALFQEKLDIAIEKASESGRAVGLLLLDMDNFKQINDSLGHDAGDMLLKMLAERLRSVVRDSDTVSRFGGDEFAVVLPELDGELTLMQVSRAIQQRLREPFVHAGRILDCRASVGASLFPQHGRTHEELLKNADIALYAAKGAGRGIVTMFEPHMRDHVQRRNMMVELARNAIADDRVVPYYQPKLDLAGHSLAGFEALLRWRTPSGKIGSPAAIAAAFEDSAVAAQISDRMVERVIADMRRWLDRGVDFGTVAINAAAAEFRRDNFAERVLEQLQLADIPASRLQLEVTETVFLGRGAEYVHRALALLNMRGVMIALDDFGTGYASLRHLKQFPVDIIKIDQSFVRDMAVDPGDEAIIRAVIDLGRNLGIRIVAEGIETEQQARRLVELDCDFGQGYLFSRAVPANRVPSLVKRWPAKAEPPQVLVPDFRLVANSN